MKTSESIKEISKAMVEFHSKVSKIAKTDNNPFFKSKYASLASILDVIAKPLNESKLVILQFPTEQYKLTTRLLHESGEWFEDTYEMQPTKHTPQDAGSVITYQRRYAIGAILNLNIDEDDDGNKASQPVKDKAPEASKPRLQLGTPVFEKCREAYLKDNSNLEKIKEKYLVDTEVELQLIKPIK
jgi:hypothetical protein